MADRGDARRTVVFFHPDLGIGGAERLVVDAAVGLQERGHRVVVFTSHCDPKHCFEEARDGESLLPVPIFMGMRSDIATQEPSTCASVATTSSPPPSSRA